MAAGFHCGEQPVQSVRIPGKVTANSDKKRTFIGFKFASQNTVPVVHTDTSAVDVSENDVDGADDGDYVSDHAAFGHLGQGLQVVE